MPHRVDVVRIGDCEDLVIAATDQQIVGREV